jgi:hypothetical protein
MTDERRSFSDAPELRRNATEAPPANEHETNEDELVQYAAAAELRAQEAEAALEYAQQETYLDIVADGEPSVESLNELFVGERGPGLRFEHMVNEMNEHDPQSAQTYLVGLTNGVVEARNQSLRAEHQERVDAARRQAAERLEQEWSVQEQRHARELADPTYRAALELVAQTSAELGQGADPNIAEAIFDRAGELYRAHRDAIREHEIRLSFAQPNFRDALMGREKSQPQPPTLEDVAARLPLQRDGQVAVSEQKVDEFRSEFAQEANRRREWTEQNRAGAARAERGDAEVKVEAELARRRR